MRISRKESAKILDQLPDQDVYVAVFADADEEEDPGVLVLVRAEGKIRVPLAKLRHFANLPQEDLLKALLKGLN